MLAATGALLIAALATLTVPIAVRRMIDYGFTGEEHELLENYFAVLIIIAAVLALASAARSYLVMTLGDRIVADIRSDLGCISFQQVEGYRAPDWPGQEHPQQMHLDVIVDDLDAGEAAVLELGATKHDYQPGTTFRVFLDPAGHPFCLCIN